MESRQEYGTVLGYTVRYSVGSSKVSKDINFYGGVDGKINILVVWAL